MIHELEQMLEENKEELTKLKSQYELLGSKVSALNSEIWATEYSITTLSSIVKLLKEDNNVLK